MRRAPLPCRALPGLAAGLVLLPLAAALATDAPKAPTASLADAAARGRAVYQRRCAECHDAGVGHPGSQMLGWTRGEDKALLETRQDLQPEYVAYVVRHGLAAMPPIRPTEVDDAALADLVAYLAPRR